LLQMRRTGTDWIGFTDFCGWIIDTSCCLIINHRCEKVSKRWFDHHKMLVDGGLEIKQSGLFTKMVV
jgi:hypothetical protein